MTEIRIIFVDDEPALCEIGKYFLERCGNLSVTTCFSVEEALPLLHEPFDAIISDYEMPEMNGIEFLRYLRQNGDERPFVILTGKGREEVVIEALNNGADFYMQKGGETKPQFAELAQKVQYAVARRKSEKKYQHLFNTSNAGIALHEIICNEFGAPVDYRFLEVNPAFEQMTGLRADEIIGKRVLEVLPGLEPYWIETYGAVALLGKTIQYENYSRDLGRYYAVTAYAPEKGQFATLIQDITDRKKQEDLLRETNEFLDNLITHANVPIIVWDSAFHIMRINHSFEQLAGCLAPDVIGRSLAILFPPHKVETCMRLIQTTQTGVRWETVELPIMQPDGTERVALWNSSTIYSSDGKTPVATIAQGRDITDEKKLIEERSRTLFQIQENIAQLAILNDGIRNPLTIIASCAEMSEESLISEKVLLEVQRIDEMVKNLDREWVSSEKILTYLRRQDHIKTDFVPATRIGNPIPIAEDTTRSSVPALQKREDTFFIEEIQSQLYTILDSIDAMVYVSDMKTYEILYINEKARALFGNVTGQKCYEKIHGSAGPCSFCTNHRLVIDGTPTGVHHWEFFNPLTDNWSDCRDRAIQWTDGRVVRLEIATDITERKWAEEKILQSELRLHTVLENLPDGIMVTNQENHRFVYTNKKIRTLLGYSREEMDKLAPADIISPPDRERVIAVLDKISKTDQIYLHDINIMRKDKNGFPSDLTLTQVELDGQICHLAICTDITEHKQAEEQKKLHFSRIQSLFILLSMANSPDQDILDYTLENSLIVSKSGYAFIGLMTPDESEMNIFAWSKDAMKACTISEKPIHFPIKNAGLWGECIRTKKPFVCNDYTIPHPAKQKFPNGHVPITRLLGVPIRDGTQIVAILTVANKETDYNEDDIDTLNTLGSVMWQMIRRNRAETALRESEERYKELVHTITSGVATYSVLGDGSSGRDYLITDVNQMALSFLGKSREEVIGKRLADIRPNIDDYGIIQVFQRAWQTGVPQYPSPGIYIDEHFANWYECRVFRLGNGDIVAVYNDITEQKQAEIELVKEHQRLQNIIDDTHAGTWEWNVETGETVFNERWAEIIGYTLLELSPVSIRTWERFTHPDDLRHAQDQLEKHFSGELPHYDCEFRMRHRDGHWVWIHDRGTVLSWTENGRPLLMFGIHIDITERKQAEQELISAQERLQETHRLAHIGTWEWAVRTDTVIWSEELYRIAGLDPSQPAPSYAEHSRVYTASSWERLSNAVTGALNTKEPYSLELELIRPDDSIRWVHAFGGVNCDETGVVTGLYGTVQDITNRKLAEESLLRKEAAIVSSLNGIAIADISGILTYVNPAFLSIWGYTDARDVLGQSVHSFWDDERQAQQVIQELQLHQSWTGEMEGKRRDKTPMTVQIFASLIRDASQRPIGMVGSFIDITEQKQAEKELFKTKNIIEGMLNGIPDVVGLQLPDYTLIRYNQAGYAVLGVSPSEVEGKKCYEILGRSIPCELCASKLAVESGKTATVEKYVPELSRYYECTSTPVFGKDGEVAVFVEILHDITEQKHNEKALRESEERYRKVVQHVPDYILVHRNGRILFVNETAATQMGYLPEELINTNIVAYLTPESRTVVAEEIPRRFAGEIIPPYEITICARDGTRRIMEVRGVLISYEGEPASLNVLTDITEQKKLLEELRENEQKLKDIFNNANDGIFIHEIGKDGSPGRFTEVNDSACQMYGFTREEFLAMTPLDIGTRYHNPDLTEIIKNQQTLGEARFETEHRKKSGSLIPVEMNTHRITLQGTDVILAVVRDITKRKRIEEALKESEERFRQFFYNTSDPIFLHRTWDDTNNGEVIEVNEAACHSLGRTRDELLTMTVFEINTPDDQAITPDILKELAEKHFFTFEGYHIRKNGSRFPVEISAHQFSFRGSPVILSVCRDISERKRIGDALSQSNQKLRLLTSLTRHDIINRLSGVDGYLELALDEDDPDLARAYISRALESEERIRAIIAFAREYENFGVVSAGWQEVSGLIASAQTEISPGTVRIKNDVPPDLFVYADPIIRKVFSTLLENALRHGVTLTFIRFEASEENGDCIISCTDDGVGVPAEKKERIFDHGYGENTGIGLFLAREILSITSLSIRECGRQGEGARFEIRVPAGKWQTELFGTARAGGGI
ncbi:MAG: PAS domain S-box protein [Methanospirillaceae archaeon]|nr:PAS domain S-box protein [Methanospirillaceae archaeon]